MPDHSNEYAVRIVRIDENDADLLPVAQAEMLPATASVGGFVDSVASRKVRPAQAFTASDINNVWIRGCERQGANRAGRWVVEDWIPGAAIVGAFPYAAVVRRHVENIWLARHTRNCDGAPTAEGT